MHESQLTLPNARYLCFRAGLRSTLKKQLTIASLSITFGPRFRITACAFRSLSAKDLAWAYGSTTSEWRREQ